MEFSLGSPIGLIFSHASGNDAMILVITKKSGICDRAENVHVCTKNRSFEVELSPTCELTHISIKHQKLIVYFISNRFNVSPQNSIFLP